MEREEGWGGVVVVGVCSEVKDIIICCCFLIKKKRIASVEVLLYVHTNRRLIRDGEPRTSTSTSTQLLSSVMMILA